jgi:SlyX protein
VTEECAGRRCNQGDSHYIGGPPCLTQIDYHHGLFYFAWRKSNMGTEDRLIDIEIKLARQEDMVDTLNQTVYRQQRKIDELEALCAALARHIKEMREAATEGNAAYEKPPHY